MASEGDGDGEVDDQNRDILESEVKQIEQEIRDVKTKLYQQKLNDIRKEIEKVSAGSHAELVDKDEGLVEMRQKRIEAAVVARTLMLESAGRVYKAEEELAVLDYERGRAKLYNDIMSRLQGELDVFERDRRERDIKVHTPTQDKTGSRARPPRTPKQAPSPVTLYVPHRKVTVPTGRPVVLMLSESAIDEDLKNMKTILKQQARTGIKGAPPNGIQTDMHEVLHVDGALLYNKKLFHSGDLIWVESLSGRYPAAITDINSSDVWVKRGHASPKRLFITGLKLGKYKIRSRK